MQHTSRSVFLIICINCCTGPRFLQMAPCCGWYWSFVKKLPIWTTLQPLAQSQVVDNVYYCSMISVSNVIRSLWLNHWSLSHLFLVSIWPRSPFAVPPAPRLPLWSKNLPDKGLCHRQGRHTLCHRPSLRQMLGIRNERTLLVLYLLSISICLCLQDISTWWTRSKAVGSWVTFMFIFSASAFFSSTIFCRAKNLTNMSSL